MKRIITIIIFISMCTSCSAAYPQKKVAEAKGDVPSIASIDIKTPDRFLNDLMLSPYWKVEKNRDGDFLAKARSIGEDWPSQHEGQFLFELMGESDPLLSADYVIKNRYLDGNKDFSSFSISVVFEKPNLNKMTLVEQGNKVIIPIYESYGSKIGPNSSSTLAIKLSLQHEIYLLLFEQGSDPDRKTSFEKIQSAVKEIELLAKSPEIYRVENRYAEFFELFFSADFSATSSKNSPKNQTLKRFPGMQDRDAFYGYFRSKAKTSYSGVNIKISHPIYCPEEGTRKYSRLQKAEYMGKPYREEDILFFLIEDNAVYLSGEHDERFGIFTGTESFEGDIEVLNDKGEVILKSKGLFKGWQR